MATGRNIGKLINICSLRPWFQNMEVDIDKNFLRSFSKAHPSCNSTDKRFSQNESFGCSVYALRPLVRLAALFYHAYIYTHWQIQLMG